MPKLDEMIEKGDPIYKKPEIRWTGKDQKYFWSGGQTRLNAWWSCHSRKDEGEEGKKWWKNKKQIFEDEYLIFKFKIEK